MRIMGFTTVNVHEAKTQFSKLVEQASQGQEVVIAKAGKPVAKLVPLADPPPPSIRRIGFLRGLGVVIPDAETFNAMAQDEIQVMFEDP